MTRLMIAVLLSGCITDEGDEEGSAGADHGCDLPPAAMCQGCVVTTCQSGDTVISMQAATLPDDQDRSGDPLGTWAYWPNGSISSVESKSVGGKFNCWPDGSRVADDEQREWDLRLSRAREPFEADTVCTEEIR